MGEEEEGKKVPRARGCASDIAGRILHDFCHRIKESEYMMECVGGKCEGR